MPFCFLKGLVAESWKNGSFLFFLFLFFFLSFSLSLLLEAQKHWATLPHTLSYKMESEDVAHFCSLCLFLQAKLVGIQEGNPSTNFYLCDTCHTVYSRYCENTLLNPETIRQLLDQSDCDLCAMRGYQLQTNQSLTDVKCTVCCNLPTTRQWLNKKEMKIVMLNW